MTDSYLYLLIKAIVTLVFILGLMGVALLVLRRFMGGAPKGGRRNGGNPVKVVSTTFLGQKRNLAVVDVAGDLIVVGMTPQSVSYITRVENPEAVEEIRRSGSGKARSLLGIFQ